MRQRPWTMIIGCLLTVLAAGGATRSARAEEVYEKFFQADGAALADAAAKIGRELVAVIAVERGALSGPHATEAVAAYPKDRFHLARLGPAAFVAVSADRMAEVRATDPARLMQVTGPFERLPDGATPVFVLEAQSIFPANRIFPLEPNKIFDPDAFETRPIATVRRLAEQARRKRVRFQAPVDRVVPVQDKIAKALGFEGAEWSLILLRSPDKLPRLLMAAQSVRPGMLAPGDLKPGQTIHIYGRTNLVRNNEGETYPVVVVDGLGANPLARKDFVTPEQDYEFIRKRLLAETAALAILNGKTRKEIRFVYRGSRPLPPQVGRRLKELQGKQGIMLQGAESNDLGEQILLVGADPDGSRRQLLQRAEAGDTLILKGRILNYRDRFAFVIDDIELPPLQGDEDEGASDG